VSLREVVVLCAEEVGLVWLVCFWYLVLSREG
jgi:hypothetical protein